MTDQPVTSSEAMRSRLRRLTRVVPSVAVLLAMGVGYHATTPTATAAPKQLPAPPKSGEMGFVVTQFHPAFHNGGDKTDCPDGLMGTLRDSYLRTLPPVERARLTKPENNNELDQKWKAYGVRPDGSNICTNMYEFLDRPATPLMKGKVAWGLNLDDDTGDGSSNPYTCKHQNFTSPTGEKGLDNQMFRVKGCDPMLRGAQGDGMADYRFGFDNNMMSGEWTQVILLRGVDSLVNDDDVDVIYANTDDRPIADSNNNPIHNASFSVSTLGRKVEFRNVLKGRIVNGVLNTATKDILLNGPGQFNLARGKLRVEFQADGSIKGLVGGYEPLTDILRSARGGGRGSVQTAAIDCVGQFNAIKMMADGDRDPKTGQCRKISYAYEIAGVPAYVNDIAPRTNIAAN